MIDIYCGKDPYKNYITDSVLKRESFFLKLLTRSNKIETPRIIPHLIDTSKKRPAIIVLPGGAFVKRATKHISKDSISFFHNLGFNVFILEYRVSPYFYPIPIEDGMRAIRYIRYYANKFGIDPNKIGMIGFSAGGHIVSLVSTSKKDLLFHKPLDKIDYVSCIPDFQILSYPCTYLSNETLVMSIANLAFIGKNNKDDLVKTRSTNFITKDTPIAFIWHTKKDKVVPFIHSQIYAKKLIEKDIQCELHLYEKGPHSLGMCNKSRHRKLEASTWSKSCEKWLHSFVLK